MPYSEAELDKARVVAAARSLMLFQPQVSRPEIYQWMSELPTRDPNKVMHWVAKGTDFSGWRQRPIGSWVPECDDTLPVGPLWRDGETEKALRERKICPVCRSMQRTWGK